MAEKEKAKHLTEPGDSSAAERPMEEIFSRLEEISSCLEKTETTLEDSVRLYQEGMELVKACQVRLDMTEKKMLQISEDGTLREFP
ncbi:MAG: exodeoxyribonuclease VII small subunit [Blautia sp.]|nr:exodeoxyribonuclease VII small subunit [Blautia sp.]